MEIPKRVTDALGITEDEVRDIIIEAAKRIAPKYSFAYHEPEDMIHEAIIIGFEGLKRYKSGPLENFISCHISNRIKSFKRDNYYRPGAANAEAKMAVMNFLDITNIDDESEDNMQQVSNYVNVMSYNEMKEIIDRELPVSFRRDYLRMRDGATSNITPKRRKEVISKIREIIGIEDVE